MEEEIIFLLNKKGGFPQLEITISTNLRGGMKKYGFHGASLHATWPAPPTSPSSSLSSSEAPPPRHHHHHHHHH